MNPVRAFLLDDPHVDVEAMLKVKAVTAGSLLPIIRRMDESG
jgi:hypothetical protein